MLLYFMNLLFLTFFFFFFVLGFFVCLFLVFPFSLNGLILGGGFLYLLSSLSFLLDALKNVFYLWLSVHIQNEAVSWKFQVGEWVCLPTVCKLSLWVGGFQVPVS